MSTVRPITIGTQLTDGVTAPMGRLTSTVRRGASSTGGVLNGLVRQSRAAAGGLIGLTTVAAGFGGVLIGLGSAVVVSRLRRAGSEMRRLARDAEAVGISAASLLELQDAALLVEGSAQGATTAVRTLREGLEDTEFFGGGSASQALAEIGVAARDARGELRSVDELLPDIADGLARLDRAERRLQAGRIFGTSDDATLALFGSGSRNLRAQLDAAKVFTRELTAERVKQLAELDKAGDQAALAFRSLNRRVRDELAPLATTVFRGTAAVVGAVPDALSQATLALADPSISRGLREAAIGLVLGGLKEAALFVARVLPSLLRVGLTVVEETIGVEIGFAIVAGIGKGVAKAETEIGKLLAPSTVTPIEDRLVRTFSLTGGLKKLEDVSDSDGLVAFLEDETGAIRRSVVTLKEAQSLARERDVLIEDVLFTAPGDLKEVFRDRVDRRRREIGDFASSDRKIVENEIRELAAGDGLIVQDIEREVALHFERLVNVVERGPIQGVKRVGDLLENDVVQVTRRTKDSLFGFRTSLAEVGAIRDDIEKLKLERDVGRDGTVLGNLIQSTFGVNAQQQLDALSRDTLAGIDTVKENLRDRAKDAGPAAVNSAFEGVEEQFTASLEQLRRGITPKLTRLLDSVESASGIRRKITDIFNKLKVAAAESENDSRVEGERGLSFVQKLNAGLDGLKQGALDAGRNLRTAFEQGERFGTALASTLTSGINNAIGGLIDKTKSWGDAFKDVGRSVLDTLRRVAIQILVVQALSGIFGAAASGGSAAVNASSVSVAGASGTAEAAGAASAGIGIGFTAPFNDGGLVRGPNVNRDVVPARLTPGEFVMQRSAVERIGVDNLAAMNRGGSMGGGGGGAPVVISPTISVTVSDPGTDGGARQRGQLIGKETAASLVEEITRDPRLREALGAALPRRGRS